MAQSDEAIVLLRGAISTLRKHTSLQKHARALSSVAKRGQVLEVDRQRLEATIADADAVTQELRAASQREKWERAEGLGRRAANRVWNQASELDWARLRLEGAIRDLREVYEVCLTDRHVGEPVWLETDRGHWLHWNPECAPAATVRVDPRAHPLVRECGRCRPKLWSSDRKYPRAQSTPPWVMQGTGSFR